MKKEKIHLEYLLNATSKNILWSAISTPTGLEDWFADKVVSDDKTVTFCWGREYFEIKMSNNELTGDYVLEISDFSDPEEVDDLKELWDSQVSKLRRTCGF